MMIRLVSLIILSFCCLNLSSGQVKKILHQSFEIEELNNIQLDLVGDYEIVEWAGNAILIETSIELYSASKDIYNFFKKEGRYDVKADTLDNAILLSSFDKERKPIKTKKGECFEIIRVRVLVPEDFDILDQNNLIRKEPTTEENSN